MIHLGLIGFPVAHSLSPKLQNAALRYHNLVGEYSLYPVDPSQPQALSELLGRVRNGELTGLNVTIPHKQTVIPLLDELTPLAQEIGAVNLIYRQNGKLMGHNTDAPGFLSDLKRFLGSQQSSLENQKAALVLGAGGSARSVTYALVNDGWTVTLAARRLEQAQALIESLKTARSQIGMVVLDQASTLNANLIVNTTPLGMTPKVETSPWPAGQAFPNGVAVYDLVYNPRETLLIKQARVAGLRATTGLGMLVEQARLGFEIWTGRSVPREVLYAVVEEK